MTCTKCGKPLPDDANFCSACGAAVADPAAAADLASGDSAPPRSPTATTASIDVGALDPQHELESLPIVLPGTAMLVVVRGPNAGSRFLLDRDETTIGRHPDSDIFLDDVTVSRRHARLRLEGGVVTVEDQGSLNGSYVNGERVDVGNLESGDELQIGRFKLLFVGDGEEEEHDHTGESE